MSDNQGSAPEAPRWTRDGPRGSAPPLAHNESALTRFLGGSPASVFLRLFFVSLIVGALFMWLDIRPIDIFRGIAQLFDRIWALGFGAVREVADYVLVGAAIVVPIWIVLRLLNMRNVP